MSFTKIGKELYGCKKASRVTGGRCDMLQNYILSERINMGAGIGWKFQREKTSSSFKRW